MYLPTYIRHALHELVVLGVAGFEAFTRCASFAFRRSFGFGVCLVVCDRDVGAFARHASSTRLSLYRGQF
jgi:hypothetical protein